MFKQIYFPHLCLTIVVILFAGAALIPVPMRAQQSATDRDGNQHHRGERLQRQVQSEGFRENRYFTRLGAGIDGVESNGTVSFGDVNNDGNPDLLTAGEDPDEFPGRALYLGDGAGNFARTNTPSLESFNEAFSSFRDFDEDGNLDLFIGGDSDAMIYLGDGQGGFAEASAGLTDVRRGAHSVGDVDNDDNLDLLVTGAAGRLSDSLTATVYLGDGQGGFTRAGAGLTGVESGGASMGDVDGDGNLDLLITGNASADISSDSLTATVYLGDGQGGFTKAEAGLTGVEGGSTSIGDLDEDGNLDLLITGENSDLDPTTTLYLGNGQGGFTQANAGFTGSVSFSSIRDFSGDGSLDVLISGTLYLGNGEGGFTEVETGVFGGGSADVVDVDGDGNLDLATTGSFPLRMYFGGKKGTLGAAQQGFLGTEGGSSSLGDLNGDGALDLLVTGSTAGTFGGPSTAVYMGNGQGGFTSIETGLNGFDSSSSSLGDVNEDGNLDLLITGRNEEFEQTTRVYLGDGQGGFTEAGAGLTDVDNGSTSIADVDGDGNLDLVITGSDTNGNPTAKVYLGDGSGSFSETDAGLTGVFSSSTSIADVDGDGNQDLLITGEDANDNPTANVYLGVGDGTFTEAGASLTGVLASSTSIADVDEDGNLDLLLTGNLGDSESNATAKLYLGNGQGGFTEAGAGLTDVDNGSTSIADVDGDGNLDLLITGYDESNLYLGDSQGGFTRSSPTLIPMGSSDSVFGDVDGDGHVDLVAVGDVAARDDHEGVLYENFAGGSFRVATDSQSVGSDGSVDFGDTGVNVNFSGTSGSGEVTVQKFGNAPPSGAKGISESTISSYRFVISAGGDLTFDNSTEVRLDVGTLGGVSNTSNVTIYRRSPRDAGLFSELSTSYDSGANELVATTGSFSEFVLASNTEPLPVELAGFEAQVKEEKVRLTWQTVSETNNARFEVQRRLGGGERGSGGAWEQVGQVDGQGTTTEAQSYRFTDAELPYEADALTYRLKQIDTDGSSAFSDPVTVECGVDAVELLDTYPNPAQSRATVRYALPEKQKATIRLYDALGRQVRTVVQAKQEGRHEHRLDTSALPSGVYFLRLRAGGQTRTQKLTVVR